MANDIAKTYTLEQFISMKYSDEMTFRNLTTVEIVDGVELVDNCLITEYLTELNSICMPVTLEYEEWAKYRFAPDLLAYDVYGSTQLDFVILLANDMIDPKEFDLKTVKLPYRSALNKFLGMVYNSNAGYIAQNRADNGLSNI